MALPKEFWEANQFGVRGGVENAYMSSSHAVAPLLAAQRPRLHMVAPQFPLSAPQRLYAGYLGVAWGRLRCSRPTRARGACLGGLTSSGGLSSSGQWRTVRPLSVLQAFTFPTD